MATLVDHFPNNGYYALQPLMKSSGHGEGSRGGRIIGHTRSGAAIYASGQHHGFLHELKTGGFYDLEHLNHDSEGDLVHHIRSGRYVVPLKNGHSAVYTGDVVVQGPRHDPDAFIDRSSWTIRDSNNDHSEAHPSAQLSEYLDHHLGDDAHEAAVDYHMTHSDDSDYGDLSDTDDFPESSDYHYINPEE